ncbi:hypothetical protein AB0J66_09480 [Actinoplanes sp. NPDC049598]|uniref:hypothetical protein n=1 Tax=Actinoplanes sp. NPDC049598 TaxID=3154626 RepID=UPI0034342647
MSRADTGARRVPAPRTAAEQSPGPARAAAEPGAGAAADSQMAGPVAGSETAGVAAGGGKGGSVAGGEEIAVSAPQTDGTVGEPAGSGHEDAGTGRSDASPDRGGAGQAVTAGAASVSGDERPSIEVAARREPWAGAEPLIRWGGLVVAIVASFVSGVFELLLSTLRAGDVVSVWGGDAIGSGGGPLLGLSVVLAAVLNYAIAWFAVTTTRRKWALGPPWALWTLMMLLAAGVRTSEGDYLLGGENWIALVMILVGSLTYAVYSYRLILKRTLP